MDINDKMQIAAFEIKEKLSAGIPITKEDRKFLNSFLNINTRKASNAGKQWKSKKDGANR